MTSATIDFGRFVAYCATHRELGNRPEQQDEILMLPAIDVGQPAMPVAAFGVFDGHGSEGGKAARFVRETLATSLPKHLAEAVKKRASGGTDGSFDPGQSEGGQAAEHPHDAAIREALRAAFLATNERLIENEAIDCYLSGTTAVVAVLTSTHCFVANVGDSRAILGRMGPAGAVESIPLSQDHTCNNPNELERVKASGARVDRNLPMSPDEPPGPLRIFKGTLPYPGLVVTRSLGDTVAQRLGVHPDPEIQVHPVRPGEGDRILLLASDGIWDGLPKPAQALQVVADSLRSVSLDAAVSASQAIIKAALKGLDERQIDDNVSAVCVLLEPR